MMMLEKQELLVGEGERCVMGCAVQLPGDGMERDEWVTYKMKTHTLSDALVALELESAYKALGWDEKEEEEEEKKKKKKSWQIKSVKSLLLLPQKRLSSNLLYPPLQSDKLGTDGWTNAHTRNRNR